MATITRPQVKKEPASAGQIIIGSTPTQGNLLVLIAVNRAGGDATTFGVFGGSGWTRFLEHNYSKAGEPTVNRRTLVGLWKIAGAAEPTTLVWTGFTPGGVVFQEFQSSEAGTWDLISNPAAVSNGDDLNATSLALPVSASVPAATNLVLGGIVAREIDNTYDVIGSFNALALTITTDTSTISAGAASQAILEIGWLQSDSAGTKTSEATVDSGNGGLSGFLAVFSPDSGGAAAPAITSVSPFAANAFASARRHFP